MEAIEHVVEVPMSTLDGSVIGMFFVVAIGIGVWPSRQASKSSADFFLGGLGRLPLLHPGQVAHPET